MKPNDADKFDFDKVLKLTIKHSESKSLVYYMGELQYMITQLYFNGNFNNRKSLDKYTQIFSRIQRLKEFIEIKKHHKAVGYDCEYCSATHIININKLLENTRFKIKKIYYDFYKK